MSGRLEPEPIKRRDFLGIASLAAAGAAVMGSVLGRAVMIKTRRKVAKLDGGLLVGTSEPAA